MPKQVLPGPLSDMDVRLLRIFRAIVEAGGLSAAEMELNIGRSTISRHLRDLETRLKVTLCSRGRGGFSLTDEGRTVYDATLRLLAAMDEFRGTVNEVHQQMRGHLSLALHDKTITNPESKIAQAIGHFDKVAPEVTMDIYVEPLNEIEKGVMEGRIHIGVIPMHRPSASLIYHKLFTEPMHLFCGAEHRFFDKTELSNNEILNQKYVGLGYHSPNMIVGNRLKMSRDATGYDQEAIALLILSGRYLGYLPDHYAQQFIDQGKMKIVRSNKFHYVCEFSAILRQSPKPSRLVQTFLNTLLTAHHSQNL